MGIYVILGVIIIIILYIFITYNILVKSNNLVKEAFSTMDVYLKKRWDLIPNLVEIVKAYAEHEKETFIRVTELRNNGYENMTINKKISINEQLAKEISHIRVISQNYPKLKANENYLQLSETLTKIEDEIVNSRKYYNATVRILNNKIEMFPSNLIAKLFGFETISMFEVDKD